MFEPISQSLYEIMMFAILGFLLASLYEPLRFSRLFIKTGALLAGIEDFIFLSGAGLIVFAYSLEFGEGYFRYFYLIGIAFGAAVYFQTVGRLIFFITKTFANAIKAAVKYIARLIQRVFILPLWRLLVKFAQKTSSKSAKIHKIVKKIGLGLKNTVRIKYNNNVHFKKQKRKQHTQENQNEVRKNTKSAIQARVIKNTQKP
ncbi:MAG: spore cortex biosynthesis protein YabQ [Oscillospiraceae bacterium]|nr:spore cortex biosynthesis protein YabQ [Oscillospiraceae bacterium]